MKPTHRKKPLSASCMQWRCDNMAEIAEFCSSHGISVEPVQRGEKTDSVWLMMRGSIISGLPPMYWVAVQQNGEVRTYSPERFDIIYEAILDGC